MGRSQVYGKSDYVFLKTTLSFCPICNKNVYLLTSGRSSKGMPLFYICFDCRFVGEVGVGRVREEK